MKLLTLNTWGGRVPELFGYIQGHSGTIDVFCFQEVLKGGVGKTDKGEVKDTFEILQDALSEYEGLFFEYGEGGYYSERSSTLDFTYGVACFVKKGLQYANLGGSALFHATQYGVTTWDDVPPVLCKGSWSVGMQ